MKQPPNYMVTVLGKVVGGSTDQIKQEVKAIEDRLNEDSKTFDTDKDKLYTLSQIVCAWNGYVLGIWATKR